MAKVILDNLNGIEIDVFSYIAHDRAPMIVFISQDPQSYDNEFVDIINSIYGGEKIEERTHFDTIKVIEDGEVLFEDNSGKFVLDYYSIDYLNKPVQMQMNLVKLN